MKKTIILAIESSCDETSASVIINGKIKSNIVATQEVHHKYGGVVPELASRAHQKNIVPVVDQALKEAEVQKSELSAIAFTKGPGLLGALLVGASFAKSMAAALNIPLIGVNHMQAHILAHFIDEPQPQFPFLCLTVSGGHTQLVMVRSHLDMEVIGETQDDAVGEAFDKTAKILGLPYPGGPLIDKYAQKGNPLAFEFPMVSTEGLSFSFSGIKTSFLYFFRKKVQENQNFVDENIEDICASVQHTLIKILMNKLRKAAAKHKVKNIGIAGGVSANSGLRKAVKEEGEKKGWDVFIPEFEYCTDNAAMIAITAHYKYLAGEFESLNVSPNPRMKFSGTR
ncbi:tRNA (adenosine(37)-N6)-threonylcarbamoyltransferase complex transferase subunit TsaD [Sediminitomix flava]|uniref:tRNA N6-adenosine threonylcarbamoyltransferase n=1 Tax=Sediminitomix flava TaxID=379075 RepID=A0A315ZGK7_SEDFL|nr:tRNA (adenosine(37)-N6)-threonylcarbamoyltransferase complex transferase subunit TsaD [Sediminitomix flava]PWJ44472.1 O-sialoglycoprotein endopeptidase [Sediminitomix flava]